MSDKWLMAFINENRNSLNESDDDFWWYMVENNLAWLYDEAGRGPIDPLLLPMSITGKLI